VRVNVEVHEGIHRLSRGVCNFYLIEQSGKFILVDAGAPGDWAFFGQALTSLGGKLADLDAVLRNTRRSAAATSLTPGEPQLVVRDIAAVFAAPGR